MIAHDIRATLKDLPLLAITPSTTEEDAMAAERKLASFNQCMVGLVRYVGQPPWERHPGGDELLHILEGEVDLEACRRLGFGVLLSVNSLALLFFGIVPQPLMAACFDAIKAL